MDELVGLWLLQVIDPTAILDIPNYLRGMGAFFLVLVIGAGMIWRYDAILERSIEASVDRPLSSLGYGVAAHVTVLFFGLYAISQLRRFGPSGDTFATLGFGVGLGLLLVFGAVGFTVAGIAVIQSRWDTPQWSGLLIGAIGAGILGLVNPIHGMLVWVIIVSTGIGGPVRNWFNATEDVQSVQ